MAHDNSVARDSARENEKVRARDEFVRSPIYKAVTELVKEMDKIIKNEPHVSSTATEFKGELNKILKNTASLESEPKIIETINSYEKKLEQIPGIWNKIKQIINECLGSDIMRPTTSTVHKKSFVNFKERLQEMKSSFNNSCYAH